MTDQPKWTVITEGLVKKNLNPPPKDERPPPPKAQTAPVVTRPAEPRTPAKG